MGPFMATAWHHLPGGRSSHYPSARSRIQNLWQPIYSAARQWRLPIPTCGCHWHSQSLVRHSKRHRYSHHPWSSSRSSRSRWTWLQSPPCAYVGILWNTPASASCIRTHTWWTWNRNYALELCSVNMGGYCAQERRLVLHFAFAMGDALGRPGKQFKDDFCQCLCGRRSARPRYTASRSR